MMMLNIQGFLFNRIFRVGFVTLFSGNILNIPEGWLACDGSEISRIDYHQLFDVIGVTFGSGDGTSTFNLPDYSFLKKEIKGNSMSMGIFDGSVNYGLSCSSSAATNCLQARTALYGEPAGTSNIGSGVYIGKAFGLTTDETKSGIVSVSDENSNYIIKYN